MSLMPARRRRDPVIRQPRMRELRPSVEQPPPVRVPRRLFGSPLMLLLGFILLILLGGLVLALPISSHTAHTTPPRRHTPTRTSECIPVRRLWSGVWGGGSCVC